MTARIPTALLVAGLAAALLAGCGSSGAGGSTDAPSSSTSNTAAPSSVQPSDAPGTGNAIAGPATASTHASPPPSTSAAKRTPAPSFTGFVGTWDGHGRRLVFSDSGHVLITFRTYVNCTATVTTGCDRIDGNGIFDGGKVVGHVGRVINATTVQVIVDSTTTPGEFPARPFILGHDLGHHAIAARVGDFTNAPFCTTGAPSGYCGA